MRRLLLGAAAGALGTLAMSAAMAAGHRLARPAARPAPEEITENVEERAGVRDDLPEPAFEASWVAAHFAYGAACGALYAVARPRPAASALAEGLAFGGLVWAVSYLGLLPALGLHPWPEDDSKARMGVMIAAHAVFGVATAAAERRLAA
jgi:hypothetical protein